MRLQYVAYNIQPPDGAVRGYGARLISGEVARGGGGVVWDRTDAQPVEPSLNDQACPEGKRAFAAWVTDKGFPFVYAYVKRCGLPDDQEIAMVDGQYAVQATTNGRESGYLYVSMWEGPTGAVVETPIPPPPAPLAGSVPHTYEADRFYGHRKYPPCGVVGCYENKTAKIHKPVKAAR